MIQISPTQGALAVLVVVCWRVIEIIIANRLADKRANDNGGPLSELERRDVNKAANRADDAAKGVELIAKIMADQTGLIRALHAEIQKHTEDDMERMQEFTEALERIRERDDTFLKVMTTIIEKFAEFDHKLRIAVP